MNSKKIRLFCYCLRHGLRYGRTKSELKRFAKAHDESVSFLLNIDYPILTAEVRETFLLHDEYIHRALEVNREEQLYLLRDKNILFDRCPQFMGRQRLDLNKATAEDLNRFMAEHDRFVGKINYGAQGLACKIYDRSKMSTDDICREIKELHQDILEAYIVQDESLQRLNPAAVNTLRIHTVNNGHEVKIFLQPKIRIGCSGSDIDISSKQGTYRALVDDDGHLSRCVFIDRLGRMKPVAKHKDTGVRFYTCTIPYIKEAREMVCQAAIHFPELPYIGWDVAITAKGPIIVEGNSISGAMGTYQKIVYLFEGHGLRREILAMFESCRH